MKKAFTMLELVFVIVVMGILAAAIIPSTRTNPAQEAAIQLLSHIRYTQHLAMLDDKYDATNATWFQERWQILFVGNTYSIESNGTPAVNPANSGTNLQNIDLSSDYSVTIASNCGVNPIISFDHIGRPLLGALNSTYGQLMTASCKLTLTGASGETVDIDIIEETGYASITF